MDWQEWLKQQWWFTNEAASNYITFLAGGLVASIVWVIGRIISKKKPSIIRVEKIFDTSLIDIHPRIRDKLKFTYEDHPIEGFYEVQFMVYNSGEAPIEDIELIFAVEDLSSVNLLEAVFTNVEKVEELKFFSPQKPDLDTVNDLPESNQDVIVNPLDYDPVEGDPNAFAIYLPFLNPLKVYEDYLGVTLYSTAPIVIKGVVGKGVGWTTKYIDRAVYYTIPSPLR